MRNLSRSEGVRCGPHHTTFSAVLWVGFVVENRRGCLFRYGYEMRDEIAVVLEKGGRMVLRFSAYKATIGALFDYLRVTWGSYLRYRARPRPGQAT